MPKIGIGLCFLGKKSTTNFFSKCIKMPFFTKKWSDRKNSSWVVMLLSVVIFWCMNESRMLKLDIHLHDKVFKFWTFFFKNKFFCQICLKIQEIWGSFWSPEHYLADCMPKTGIAPCFLGKKSTTKFFSKCIKMPFFHKKNDPIRKILYGL